MAYSDYGGYAYRNGARVDERSDAVLSPEGIKSTPGQWPGWTMPEARNGGSFHVLLGDGPIFVGMHKQSYIEVRRLGEELNVADLLAPESRIEGATYEHAGSRFLDKDPFVAADKPCILLVDGHRIEARWTTLDQEDNHYQYVRLEQPDGTVWHGWSGYGVGAGLEDCGYGFSASERDEKLREFWPGAIPA